MRGWGGLLVQLLGSRNSLGLLTMIALKPLLPPPPHPSPSLPLQITLHATPPPSNPKFSGKSFNRPHHPFFLSTARPLLSPFGIPSKLLPSQQTSPPSPTWMPPGLWFFLVIRLSSKPIRSSKKLSLSLSFSPLLSGSLSPSPREVKYSQLLLRSGRTATRLSEQTEELWTCEANGVRFIWGPTQVR